MVISSTRFPRKKIHTATWRSPDRRTANQIDHVFIDGRHASNILDVRSFRGANVESDQFLVGARFRARLSNVRKLHQATKRSADIGRLSTLEIARAYEEQLSEILSDMPTSNRNANDMWLHCRSAIKEVAEATLGYLPPPTKNLW